jgi:hypothetical protein
MARRYNFLFLNSSAPNRRNYYRQYYIRLFFGRAQYSVYFVGSLIYITSFWKKSTVNTKRYLDFVSFTHDFEEFDDEIHPAAKYSVIRHKNKKMLHDFRDRILDERAQIANQNRLEAIDKFAKI